MHMHQPLLVSYIICYKFLVHSRIWLWCTDFPLAYFINFHILHFYTPNYRYAILSFPSFIYPWKKEAYLRNAITWEILSRAQNLTVKMLVNYDKNMHNSRNKLTQRNGWICRTVLFHAEPGKFAVKVRYDCIHIRQICTLKMHFQSKYPLHLNINFCSDC